MKRLGAAWGMWILAGCAAEPEGVRWLASRGAAFAMDPPAKMHVVSGFPSADGIKVSGPERVVFCAMVRYPDPGGRQKLLTEHGAADTTYTHVLGSKSVRYTWDRKEERLLAEGKVFPLAKGRLFLLTLDAKGGVDARQLEVQLDDLTPAVFDEGTGLDKVLGAFQDALGDDAPAYGFAN
jgi:hypothetical protein